VHTIAFGQRDDAAAEHGDCSQFHAAAGGIQLSQVLVQIAAKCTAVEGLVKRLAESDSVRFSMRFSVL
jgi:hypothetical protein